MARLVARIEIINRDRLDCTINVFVDDTNARSTDTTRADDKLEPRDRTDPPDDREELPTNKARGMTLDLQRQVDSLNAVLIADLPGDDPDKSADPNTSQLFWGDSDFFPVTRTGNLAVWLVSRRDIFTVEWREAIQEYTLRTHRA